MKLNGKLTFRVLAQMCLIVVCLLDIGIVKQVNAYGRSRTAEFQNKSSDVVTYLPMERVMEEYTGDNGFSWKSGYEIGLDKGNVIVRVAINLVPAKGVKKMELTRAKKIWKDGIERIWSEKFALKTASNKYYPIIVNVRFKGADLQHDVIVRPGAGRTDELNWNILDSQELVAHEFGHMLGLYDEYKGGTLNQNTAIIDSMGIMGANPGQEALTRTRYYEPFRRWFMERTKMENVMIVKQQEVHS